MKAAAARGLGGAVDEEEEDRDGVSFSGFCEGRARQSEKHKDGIQSRHCSSPVPIPME